VPVKRADIHEVEDRAGVCVCKGPPAWVDPDIDTSGKTRGWIERRIMVLLAGSEAEYIRIGKRNHIGADSDYRATLNLAPAVCDSDKEGEAYIAWLAVRVADLLKQKHVWAAVIAVAEALLERGELSGRQVRQLVRTSSS
jgi:hypothetical protein